MACTAASRLFGYVKIALVGALFGATGQADAVWLVFAIPNDLRKLFAEGAISSAFIPAISTCLVEDSSGERARSLARNLLTLQLLILLPFVAASMLFPRTFVRVFLSFADPGKVELAAGLFRWMFSYILLVSLAATVMAVLNSHQSFVVPALSPVLFSLVIIAAVVILRGALGPYAIALGVAVGGVAQLGFQIPAYLRRGYDLRPSLSLSHPDVRRTVAMWLPFLASASIFTINTFVARLFASGLEDGSVSALQNAVTFLQLPVGLFTVSVMTVLFPAMSRQAAGGEKQRLARTVASGLQFLTVLLIPSAVFLVGFGRDLISVALQRGLFEVEGTAMAARVLTGYALGLLSLGFYSFLQRLFYALKDFRTPIVSAILICGVDIALSLVLKETPLRVAGLAYANTAAFTVGFVYLFLLARRRLGRLGTRVWLLTAAKTALASLPMVGLLVGYRRLFPDLWSAGSTLPAVGIALAVTALCVATTFASLLALRVSQIRDIVRLRGRKAALTAGSGDP
jgi:putative peptidoglycan lipid II flippase